MRCHVSYSWDNISLTAQHTMLRSHRPSTQNEGHMCTINSHTKTITASPKQKRMQTIRDHEQHKPQSFSALPSLSRGEEPKHRAHDHQHRKRHMQRQQHRNQMLGHQCAIEHECQDRFRDGCHATDEDGPAKEKEFGFVAPTPRQQTTRVSGSDRSEQRQKTNERMNGASRHKDKARSAHVR